MLGSEGHCETQRIVCLAWYSAQHQLLPTLLAAVPPFPDGAAGGHSSQGLTAPKGQALPLPPW